MRVKFLALAAAALLASVSVVADEPVLTPAPARVTCSPDGKVVEVRVYVSIPGAGWLTLVLPPDVCTSKPVDGPQRREPSGAAT